TFLRRRRHLCAEGIEVLGHCASPVVGRYQSKADRDVTYAVSVRVASDVGRTNRRRWARTCRTTLDRLSCRRRAGAAPCGEDQTRRAPSGGGPPPCLAVLHVGVTGSGNHVGMGTRRGWAALLQQFNLGADFELLIFGQGVPPGLKLAGELFLPCQEYNTPYVEYSAN